MKRSSAVPWAVFAIVSGVAGCGAGAGGQTAANEVVVPAIPPAKPAMVASASASAVAPAASATGSEPGEPGDEEAAEGEETAEFGMIGLLNSAAGGNPNAPWALDDSIGDSSAKGGIFGARVGDSGLGGLGLVGGVGTVPALGGASGHARVTLGEPEVGGRLPPEVIKRIVRTNLGRYRICFENGLKKNHNLQGRVRVRFVIGRDGAVNNVSNGGSDLPDADVIGCVVRSFYGLGFPQPDGGIVTVLYPLSFTPGAAPAAAKPAPSATPVAPTSAPSAAPASKP